MAEADVVALMPVDSKMRYQAHYPMIAPALPGANTGPQSQFRRANWMNTVGQKSRDFDKKEVGELMRQDSICYDPSDDVRLALKTMAKEKIHIDDGLVGAAATLKNDGIRVGPSDIPAENRPSMAEKCAPLRIVDTGCAMDLSEPGQETEFDFYFPAAPESEADSELPGTSKEHPSETILVAEDELPVRDLVRQALEQLGYTVLEAPNGYEAMRVIEKHTGEINLLLTDVTMPLMNGPELAVRLQTIRPGTKVLYMSGYIDGALAFHDSAQPEIAFIQKPFTLSELATKVETALSAG